MFIMQQVFLLPHKNNRIQLTNSYFPLPWLMATRSDLNISSGTVFIFAADSTQQFSQVRGEFVWFEHAKCVRIDKDRYNCLSFN